MMDALTDYCLCLCSREQVHLSVLFGYGPIRFWQLRPNWLAIWGCLPAPGGFESSIVDVWLEADVPWGRFAESIHSTTSIRFILLACDFGDQLRTVANALWANRTIHHP
jgi:hypothetical protein